MSTEDILNCIYTENVDELFDEYIRVAEDDSLLNFDENIDLSEFSADELPKRKRPITKLDDEQALQRRFVFYFTFIYKYFLIYA